MNNSNMPLGIVHTNDVYLLCPSSEKFFINLPESRDHDSFLSGQKIFDDAIIKLGSHTHVQFFSLVISTFLPAVSSRTWRMLDIGGYIGAIGLPIAKWAKDALPAARLCVDIFEPTELSDLINKSIELNRLSSFAAVHPLAVSSKSGQVTFSHIDGQKVAGRIGTGFSSKTTVNAIDIDSYLPRLADNLLIVKVDTEGHEPAVISGMLKTLDQNLVVAVLEFHSFCIGKQISGIPYEQFLFDRFHLFNLGNVGYPGTIIPIECGDIGHLRSLDRDGSHLSDILCIDKRIPNELVARFCSLI